MGERLCDGDCPDDPHIHVNVESGGVQPTFQRSMREDDPIVLDGRLDEEGEL